MCMFLHRGLCMHQKSQGGTPIFFESLLPLCGPVVFKKYMLNMESNITLIVLMETLDWTVLRFTAYLMNTL